MDYTRITINATSRQLFLVILMIGLLNLGFLLGSWLCNTIDWNSQNFVISFLLRESNLAWENTVAAWYSSMLLLTVSILCIVCFGKDSKQNPGKYQRIFSYGWIIISLIFAILSLDEVGSIHESLGNLDFAKNREIEGDLLTIVFYSLVILVALFMAFFGYLRFKNNKRAIVFGFLGIALFVTIPLQEFIEWSDVNWEVTTTNTSRKAISIIIEEGTEIFGSLNFIACLMAYLTGANQKESGSRFAVSLNILVRRRNVFFFLFLVAGIFGLAGIILHQNWSNVDQNDNGIYENWFPSALAFFTAISAYYKYINKEMRAYLLVAFLCLFISAFFGSNLYARIGGLDNQQGLVLKLMIVISVVLGSVLLFIKLKEPFARGCVFAWLCLLIYVIFQNQDYPGLGSLASLILLFAFNNQPAEKKDSVRFA